MISTRFHSSRFGKLPHTLTLLGAIVCGDVFLPPQIPFAAAQSPERSDSMLSQAGRKLFETHCVACHGFTGEGNGPVAAALTPKPADLTTILKRHGASYSWGEVAKYIDGRTELPAHGQRDMPVWGKSLHSESMNAELREEEIQGDLASLIQYLKTIQKK